MTLLTGEHVSTDFAIVNGRTVWCRHTLGIPAIAGTFDYWIVQARARPTLENTCRRWISTFLSDYTGMLNLETIGGYIIEAHLRFADQWPDLYGRNWLDSVVRLYQFGTWDFNESRRSDGYSIVLFGPHDRSYVYPSIKRQTEYRATPGIDSVQITFFADQAAHLHAMPPGGFRLAIINTKNMATGILLRESIARDFGVRQGSDVRPSRRSQEVSYG